MRPDQWVGKGYLGGILEEAAGTVQILVGSK